MKATNFFFSACKKPVDKQKRFATRASELPTGGNPPMQTHCCGFPFALDSSTVGVRPQQCPGLSVWSC